MGAKIQAFDIFQTPLSSHYPLPLKYDLLISWMYFWNFYSQVFKTGQQSANQARTRKGMRLTGFSFIIILLSY
jgi:hypothetical protein